MDPRSAITVHYMEPKAKKRCYTVMIYGESILTTVTSDPDVVNEWILADVIQKSPLPRRIGFEIEFDMKTAKIGTLQLCIGNRCLVYQLTYANPFFPFTLALLLADTNNAFIGSHVGSKIGLLRATFPCNPMVEVRDFMGNAPFINAIKKQEMASLRPCETDWNRLPLVLSVKQAHYACLDAFLNLYIWDPLFTTEAFTTIVRQRLDSTIITPHVGRRADANSFYDAVFMGKTTWITVTADLVAVQQWIDAQNIVDLGFETEYDKNAERVGTMQIFTGNRCLVFQLRDANLCPPGIDQFLNTHSFAGDPDMTQKVQRLRQQFKFESHVARVDISMLNGEDASRWKGNILACIGLAGEEDWARHGRLSDKQVHYACYDALLNLQLLYMGGTFN